MFIEENIFEGKQKDNIDCPHNYPFNGKDRFYYVDKCFDHVPFKKSNQTIFILIRVGPGSNEESYVEIEDKRYDDDADITAKLDDIKLGRPILSAGIPTLEIKRGKTARLVFHLIDSSEFQLISEFGVKDKPHENQFCDHLRIDDKTYRVTAVNSKRREFEYGLFVRNAANTNGTVIDPRIRSDG